MDLLQEVEIINSGSEMHCDCVPIVSTFGVDLHSRSVKIDGDLGDVKKKSIAISDL